MDKNVWKMLNKIYDLIDKVSYENKMILINKYLELLSMIIYLQDKSSENN